MYHRVSVEPGPLVVTRDSFSAQQEMLARRYEVVSLEQVAESVRGGPPLPPRAVLVTFDDGYRDNLDVAKPILDEFGHRATIFVPTDFIGSQRRLPHDRRWIPTLNWEELGVLAETFSVGSHGCSHRVMTGLSTLEVERELIESKRLVEEHLDRSVIAFAYPKGSVTGRLQCRVGATRTDRRIRAGVHDLARHYRPPWNQYAIRRHNVEDFGLDYFEALLDGSAALLALKDTRAGYWAKRVANRAKRS